MQGIAQKPVKTKTLDQIGKSIGNTPLLKLQSLSTDSVSIYAKAEWAQLSGSVKARAAYAIVRDAWHRGELHKGKALLDASSGNTAIAYGAIGRQLNIPVTICLPSNASSRRIELLQDLGVDIVFTSPFEGTEGAQAEARKLYAEAPDRFFYADQYSNTANWRAHYEGTAPEIVRQTNGTLTHFVAGLGTTGTFTGTTRYLREHFPHVRCIGLQPDGPMHIMEGWKHLETADVPAIYEHQLADEILEVSSEETIDIIEFVAAHEGIRLSPSAAANVAGAKRVAAKLDRGLVVTILADSISRYSELEKEIFGE